MKDSDNSKRNLTPDMSLRLQNQRLEIVQSLSKVYFLSYYIDFPNNFFIELSSRDYIHKEIGFMGRAQEKLNLYCEKFAKSVYHTSFNEFLDLSTIEQRLKDKVYITYDFEEKNSGWCQAFFIMGDKTSEGNLSHIYFSVRPIQQEKERELRKQRLFDEQLSIIDVLSYEYSTLLLLDPQSQSFSVYRAPSNPEDLFAMDYFLRFKNYTDSMNAYIDRFVVEEDRNFLKKKTNIRSLLKTVNKEKFVPINFRRISGRGFKYYQINFALVHLSSDQKKIVVAFRDINQTILRDLKEKTHKVYYEQLFVDAASDIYSGLVFVDFSKWRTRRITTTNGVFTETRQEKWDVFVERMVSYVHEEDQNLVREALSRKSLLGIKDSEKKSFSYRNATPGKNGEFSYFTSTIHVQTNEGHRYATVFTTNNTHVVRKEEEQKRLLENALKEAEHANISKTTFLSNMSHDIRTPMNAIIGFSNMALKNIDDKEKVSEDLHKVLDASQHLLSLINDILDMSRIESGRLHIQNQICNIKEVITSLVNVMEGQIKAKQQELIVNLDSVKNPYAITDPVKLNQILINLVSNSVKYTNAGGKIFITVSQKESQKDNFAVYQFSVKDTGVGISSDFLPHIFDPFEREDSATRTGIQGTGLGMSITKALVDAFGGKIRVESEKGIGTEFKVELELELIQTEEYETIVTKDEKEESFNFAGKRILLVEDNLLNREIAEDILKDAEFVVDSLPDGSDAVRKMTEVPENYYCAILMDVQMPVMNGYEATLAIRNLHREDVKTLPIFAMTANALEDDRIEALKNGMTEHISKPIDVKKFLKILKEYI